MSAARTSTIPVGSRMSPSAGPPSPPTVCRATPVYPLWATRSTVYWILTLSRVVTSWTQRSATPYRNVARAAVCPTAGSLPLLAAGQGGC